MAKTQRRKPNDLMRITEAADRLGIARSTLMYRVARGMLTAETVAGVTFIKRADVERAEREKRAA